jgi:hypothetical protein
MGEHPQVGDGKVRRSSFFSFLLRCRTEKNQKGLKVLVAVFFFGGVKTSYDGNGRSAIGNDTLHPFQWLAI